MPNVSVMNMFMYTQTTELIPTKAGLIAALLRSRDTLTEVVVKMWLA